MGLYVERITITAREPGLWHDGYVVYRQPAWRYWSSRVLSWLDRKTFRLQREIDRRDTRDMNLDLDNLEFLDPKDVPLITRIDLWLYEFRNAGRVPVTTWVEPEPGPLNLDD